MSDAQAFIGADIFDGHERHRDRALLVRDGMVAGLRDPAGIEADCERIELDGGLLAPGFVDIQVNGGGGVLLNENPTVEGVRAICEAHARAGGSTALLPTVITDRPEITFAAIEAVERSIAAGVPGCVGIHVEGPFISIARKGAHDPALIRAMEDADLDRLCSTALRPFLLTVAPESVSNRQIEALARAGILVSLGHTDCDYDTAMAAFEAGASGVTHLFNAMSQLGHRAPGLVGAALESSEVSCGFIPDGHHVHPASLRAALAAKQGTGRMLAVTDAMPTAGSPVDSFVLNGRTATRENGRLTLADGTLAGSDLLMVEALRYLVQTLEMQEDEALRLCGLHPATFLGLQATHGHLRAGARADIVHLTPTLDLAGTWIGGRMI